MCNERIIVGIDPGSRITGYSFLRWDGHTYTPIDFGCISMNPRWPLSRRIATLYTEISALLDTYKPDEACIESLFYAKNVRAVISLGEARGVLLLAMAQRNIPIFDYSPREVKKAVTGNGNASKEQVQFMIRALLKLHGPIKSFDVTDAIAIAICHCHRKLK